MTLNVNLFQKRARFVKGDNVLFIFYVVTLT